MNDFPEWIKLVPNGINSFESTNRQNNHSKKYIRADVAAQRIRALESALLNIKAGSVESYILQIIEETLEPPR